MASLPMETYLWFAGEFGLVGKPEALKFISIHLLSFGGRNRLLDDRQHYM